MDIVAFRTNLPGNACQLQGVKSIHAELPLQGTILMALTVPALAGLLVTICAVGAQVNIPRSMCLVS